MKFIFNVKRNYLKDTPDFPRIACCVFLALHNFLSTQRFFLRISYSRNFDIQLDSDIIAASVCAPKGTFLDVF